MRWCILVFALAALDAQDAGYSREKELALGAQLAREAHARFTPLDSAQVREFVDRVTRRLAGSNPDYAWHVEAVIDNIGGATHEPVWLPGGHIFVPAELLRAARNQPEFAAMLAHAMAHVIARHGFRRIDAAAGKAGSSVPLVFLGTWLWSGDDNSAIPVAWAAANREYELEADRAAVAMLSAGGYDPTVLRDYIARVQPETLGRFSRLPARDERVAAISALLRR